MRTRLHAVALASVACAIAISACGGGSDSTVATEATVSTAPAAPPPPSGPRARNEGARPLVRACRRLGPSVRAALAAGGFEAELKRRATATANHGQCTYRGGGAQVKATVDVGADVLRRYQVRVTELAQFSNGDPEQAPHPVAGVGARRLGPYGANWIPGNSELLSVMEPRMLILEVTIPRAPARMRRDAAIAVSQAIWDRLPAR
jgi:hypothetical protein